MKRFLPVVFFFVFVMLFGHFPEAMAGMSFRKLDSIQIVVEKNQLILPGESFQIGVISYHKNGKVRKTVGMDNGSVWWWRYETEIVGGERNGGKIRVNEKLMPSKGKYIRVKIWPQKQEKLAKTILIPLNYETQVSFKPVGNFDKAPGCMFEGEIVARFNNGMVRRYPDLNSRSVENLYDVLLDGVTQKRSKFIIEPDFQKINDHLVSVYVQSKLNPEIHSAYDLQLDYKHNYHLAFSGSSGMNGFYGSNGSSGCSGHDGRDGGHGAYGQPGENGPDIGVWADCYFDSVLQGNLIYVYAENLNTGEEFRYLINPDGGAFNVKSQGGRGGNGGDGGHGGDGGRGADGDVWYETIAKTRIVNKPFTETITKKEKKRRTTGTGNEEEYEEKVTETITVYRDVKETYYEQIRHQKPGEDGGDGGNGGAGGLGGPGGNGGNIYLHFTTDAKPYADLILAVSDGGSGGSNGDGGHAGSGGAGGYGNPNGRNGRSGYEGPDVFGWAPEGYRGEIFIEPAEEFFFYKPVGPAQNISRAESL